MRCGDWPISHHHALALSHRFHKTKIVEMWGWVGGSQEKQVTSWTHEVWTVTLWGVYCIQYRHHIVGSKNALSGERGQTVTAQSFLTSRFCKGELSNSFVCKSDSSGVELCRITTSFYCHAVWSAFTIPGKALDSSALGHFSVGIPLSSLEEGGFKIYTWESGLLFLSKSMPEVQAVNNYQA